MCFLTPDKLVTAAQCYYTAEQLAAAAAPQGDHSHILQVQVRSSLSSSATKHGRFVYVSRPQLRPLLRKLNAGQPIVVAAFGSSITAVYGGCFQREDYKKYVRRLGAKYEYNHMAQLAPEHKGDCTKHPVSWLTTFMKQINTTWPHPGHVLINLGASGAHSLMACATGGVGKGTRR